MTQLRLYFDREDGPHDVVLTTDDDPPVQLGIVFRDVTAEAAPKLVAEFDMVDLSDREHVTAIQADVARRMPLSYSWHYRETQRQRALNAPARRCNGQYKAAGVAS